MSRWQVKKLAEQSVKEQSGIAQWTPCGKTQKESLHADSCCQHKTQKESLNADGCCQQQALEHQDDAQGQQTEQAPQGQQGHAQGQQDQGQRQVSFDMSSPLTLEEVRKAAGQGNERAAKALTDLGRFSEGKKQRAATVAVIHRMATQRNLPQYIDPYTGFTVFTATYLKQRACCGFGCRHCPHPSERCAGNLGSKSKEMALALASDW